MKKSALLVVTTLTLVSCQIAKTDYQVNQPQSNQDEYQEEAYPIGQQEESYQQKKTSR